MPNDINISTANKMTMMMAITSFSGMRLRSVLWCVSVAFAAEKRLKNARSVRRSDAGERARDDILYVVYMCVWRNTNWPWW